MAAEGVRKPDVGDRVWIGRCKGTVVDRMKCYLCMREVDNGDFCNCDYKVRIDEAYRRPLSSSCIEDCRLRNMRLLTPLELLAEV